MKKESSNRIKTVKGWENFKTVTTITDKVYI
jgi:hypothetical protein